ncbi:hypothetical protein GQ457_12G018290 [Hibiscus cannabinus]
MLQHSRKDDEHKDTAALDFPGSRDATAYRSAEQTKCRKDKAAKIFCCSHGTPAGIDHPYKRHIKGAEKRELGRKEREEKVLRLGIVRNTIAYSVEHISWDYTTASIRLKEDRTLLQAALVSPHLDNYIVYDLVDFHSVFTVDFQYFSSLL